MSKVLRVQAANFPIHGGQIQHNTTAHLRLMAQAYEANITVLVFPSLSLVGTNLGSLYELQSLEEKQETAVEEILHASLDYPTLFTSLGVTMRYKNHRYIVQLLIHNGMLLACVPQEHISPSRRYYYQGLSAWTAKEELPHIYAKQDITLGSHAVSIGEGKDRISLALLSGDAIDLRNPNLSRLSQMGVTLLLLSDSNPKLKGSFLKRREQLRTISAAYNLALVYSNSTYGESGSDMIFAGEQWIMEAGNILEENRSAFTTEDRSLTATIDCNYLEQLLMRNPWEHEANYDNYPLHVDVTLDWTYRQDDLYREINPYPFIPTNFQARSTLAEEVLQIQAAGLAKRLNHIHAKYLVLGVSGGLDSTLALMVCLRALKQLDRDYKDILAVEMPGFGTSEETSTNSHRLLDSLGVSRRKIDIIPATLQHFEDIGHDPEILDHTYENAQARERTQILMDIANKENGIVVGTGDLSELALGWCTYNGDQMSMYSVNHSIPKTLIRPLLQHESMLYAQGKRTDLAKVLEAISKTAVSPELLPPTKDGEIQQKTEDIIGPYVLHDFFLYHYLERGKNFIDIFHLACQAFAPSNALAKENYTPGKIKEVLLIFIRRFFQQQFKRIPSPDGITVSSLNLSPRGGLHLTGDVHFEEMYEEIQNIEI